MSNISFSLASLLCILMCVYITHSHSPLKRCHCQECGKGKNVEKKKSISYNLFDLLKVWTLKKFWKFESWTEPKNELFSSFSILHFKHVCKNIHVYKKYNMLLLFYIYVPQYISFLDFLTVSWHYCIISRFSFCFPWLPSFLSYLIPAFFRTNFIFSHRLSAWVHYLYAL